MLLQYRIASLSLIGHSPAQLFLNRSLRSTFPVVSEVLDSSVPDKELILEARQKNTIQSEKYYNQTADTLPPIQSGDESNDQKAP